VGGKTSGSATTASTRNFQRHREKASQAARGVPTASRMAVVETESRTLSQIACQSMIIRRARRSRTA
jgi:hypothetical protein